MSRRKATVPVCRAPALPSALSPQEKLALMEIPDCRCALAKEPFCVTDDEPDGCGQRQETGDCDCLYRFVPCEHIKATKHNRSLDVWGRMLFLAYPRDYDEPSLPPEPADVMRKDARVAVMTLRRRQGRGLYHEGDTWRKEDLALPVAPVAHRGGNGATTVYDKTTGALVREQLVCEGVS
jgi:hypothetical protein